VSALLSVMRNFPQGVCVVTVDAGDRPRGITVSSLASISLSPPLVSIVISHASESLDSIERAGAFSINVLSEKQGSVSEHFARSGLVDQFRSIPFDRASSGAPRLRDCVAYLDCRTVKTLVLSEHTLFIGEVEHAEMGRSDARPLIYYGRAYWSVGSTVYQRG
jgi:flavin reductase (DIM6/NTAB) family NADH-FMN oxidoreductase RutF